jgi:hypothetical protein
MLLYSRRSRFEIRRLIVGFELNELLWILSAFFSRNAYWYCCMPANVLRVKVANLPVHRLPQPCLEAGHEYREPLWGERGALMVLVQKQAKLIENSLY